MPFAWRRGCRGWPAKSHEYDIIGIDRGAASVASRRQEGFRAGGTGRRGVLLVEAACRAGAIATVR